MTATAACGGKKPPPPSPRLLLHPVHCLSLGFGAGLSPAMPGTVGTLLGLILYWPLHPLLGPRLCLVLTVCCALLGIVACGQTARRLGVPDHRAIVWDEVVGYWLTMSLAPTGPVWLVAGFVLFRILDIGKPWPIRWVDRSVGGGLGIMADDLLAAVFAAGILQLLDRLLPV